MNIKIVLIICFMYTFVFADKYLEAKYDISYGILGKLGVSKATIKVTDNRYVINVKAKATGIADILAGGRREEYISIGEYKNDRYIPKIFKTIKVIGDEKYINRYIFDYELKKIKRIYLRYEFKNDNWVQQKAETSFEKFFAKEDILSIFFNLKHYALDLGKTKTYQLVALGANKDDGIIDIIVPSKKKLKEINSVMDDKKAKKLIVIINQEIFSSKNGSLFVSIQNNGICSGAVLKDVLFFGDIKGTLREFKKR